MRANIEGAENAVVSRVAVILTFAPILEPGFDGVPPMCNDYIVDDLTRTGTKLLEEVVRTKLDAPRADRRQSGSEVIATGDADLLRQVSQSRYIGSLVKFHRADSYAQLVQ